MSDKYILEGHEAVECNDLMEWADWFEGNDRNVAKTYIGMITWKYWLGKLLHIKKFEPVKISTVFLGLNHRFGEGEPELFETMVFGGEYDQEMERYATWEQAEKGHKEWVEKVS